MKFNLGFYSAKAVIVLAVYCLFTFGELTPNLFEWSALSRVLFVVLSVGLFFNRKPTEI
jgi:hypothetical protein